MNHCDAYSTRCPTPHPTPIPPHPLPHTGVPAYDWVVFAIIFILAGIALVAAAGLTRHLLKRR